MEVPPPNHCPGVGSENAGKSAPCAGCPNQKLCSSDDAKQAAQAELDALIPLIVNRLIKIKHIIIVMSGKGGTGKSTVTATLARSFEEKDEMYRTGVLDLDICGPSAPRIFGVEGEQVHKSTTGWTPVYSSDGVAVMSSGFLLDSLDDAVIWRGPKKNTLIKQFLSDVDWEKMDYLFIDTPPGTSDEHLSVLQYLQQTGLPNIDGAIIVTTPQEVALMDVRKQLKFCQQKNLKILGVIENMSGFTCLKCTQESSVFPTSSGGAASIGVEVLGKIALNPIIGQTCDAGESIFALESEHASAEKESSVLGMIVYSFRSIRDRLIEIVDGGK